MYLITGGAGFIGSNIARRLASDGQKVRILDDFSTGKKENLVGINGIEIIEGSLLNLAVVKKSVDGIKYILHQGAIPSVPRSINEPLVSNEANITGTLKLLETARNNSVKRFIFAASSSAYGDLEILPKTENMTEKPQSPYAITKYCGELYTRVYSKIHGLPTVILRYFNVFGPYQDPSSEYAAVIPKFIESMLEGKAPVIYGDGNQSRDFTYIDNVIEANILACISSSVGQGEIINVACGDRYSLNELVRLLNEIIGTKISPVYTDPRKGDVRHSQADISLAKELLGYKVKVPFYKGLEKTVAWFRKKVD